MSPLHNLIDQIQREPGNPIPYAEEPRWTPPPARIIVSGGQWTDQATAGDRARLADRLAPVDDVRTTAPKPWMFAMSHRPARINTSGLTRQGKHKHLIPQVDQWRAEGMPWGQITDRIGFDAMNACRVMLGKRKKKAMAAGA